MGVGRGPGPLRNAGIGSPASSHHCTTPKWLPNSDRPFGDRPMTITMVQIQLRDCDYLLRCLEWAHRAVPGIDRNGCCHRRATGPPATFERRPPIRRSARSQSVAGYPAGSLRRLLRHAPRRNKSAHLHWPWYAKIYDFLPSAAPGRAGGENPVLQRSSGIAGQTLSVQISMMLSSGSRKNRVRWRQSGRSVGPLKIGTPLATNSSWQASTAGGGTRKASSISR